MSHSTKDDSPHELTPYERAAKRVHDLKGFYIHLVIYIFVIVGLAILNISSIAAGNNDGGLWFLYPAFGWGFAVVIHGVTLFTSTSDWEERKIREFMKAEREKENSMKNH